MADIISRLKLESGEFDSKIKRAGQELMAYSEHCRKTGLQMGFANKDARDFAKSLGNMQTTSTTARGKINELSDAFVNLRVMYKNMTDEEKNNQFGKNLAASLDQLKTRIQEAKNDLSSVTSDLNDSKFGQFGSVIDTIGQKIGITGNLTEMLTSKTALMTAAIGAGGAAAGKAAEMWASYNSEIAKQDNVVTVTTGLKDDDAKRMTDAVRALAGTYNVDFRDAVNAANTLMTQFGKTGDEAIQLLRDGMQGMIQGDGGKLLSMIQQYAPSFRDAGIEASQLVAIIQNSEGGIFTDQNMNAIVMGIKNIRLMTNATSEALQKVGIDSEEMTKKLNSGSMTIFEALRQVSNAIENTGSSSQAAGEVMQQVFGRQGAMAGTKLGEAIATLNINLEETKKQTGDLGNAYRELEIANENLNKAIRDCFEYDGWEVMKTELETGLVTALSDVLNSCKSLYGMLEDIGSLKVFEFIANSVLRCVAPFTQLYRIAKELFKELGGSGSGSGDAPRPKAGVKNLADDPNVDDNGNYRVKNVKNNKPRLVSKPGEPVRYEGSTESVETDLNPVKPVKPKNISIPRTPKQSTEDMLLSSFSKTNSSIDPESLKWKYEPSVNMWDILRKDHYANLKPEQRMSRADFEEGQSRAREHIENTEDPFKYEKKQLAKMDAIAGNIGNITSGLAKMGIELPEGVTEMVEGIQTVISIISSIMTLVTLISSIQSVKSIPIIGWALANGGIAGGLGGRRLIHAAGGTVVGNTYSGDQIPAMLNAGEVVLSKAQAGVIASDLQGGGMQNMNLQAVVTGEQLRFILNANSRRRGKGEYVTSTHQ